MKTSLLITTLFISVTAGAQYYYKDIIGTKETSDMIRGYRNNKVSRVLLTSYDTDNSKIDDFYVEQQFSSAAQTLRTITRSGALNESVLTAYTDANGNVIKTVDSSGFIISVTNYKYNDAGQLISVNSSSSDSSNTSTQTEEHLWHYNNGKVFKMLRIKNKIDTTHVEFQSDENGNVIEEKIVSRGIRSEPVQYFYDANNRLTDIVRYHIKARRLLPEYLFEYSESNQVIQKITVPANSSKYMIWRYQYNNQGLKIKEAVYSKDDKRKQLGRVEYQYSFGL